jgi:hypothetical protein
VTDDELVAAFEGGRIRGDDFRHVDHVHVGFLFMRRFQAWDTLRRFSRALARMAAASGQPARYHETITWAFLLLIRERIARWNHANGRPPSWDEFLAHNVDLLEWKDHVLKNYYEERTLASDLARATFLLPDRGVTPVATSLRDRRGARDGAARPTRPLRPSPTSRRR